MKPPSKLGFSLLGLSLLLSCNPKPPPDIIFAEPPVESALPTELNDYFLKRFPSDEPGGAVLIMSGDSILFSKGYGLADMKTKVTASSQTLFNIGSISKTFVANAILILQEQGKLSVEDNLLEYFPEFNNTKIAEEIQIKHLLTHTSGLPDIRNPWKDSIFYLTAKDKENWAPIMKATQLNFEPGAKYEYSNPAFNALALIVENVSGMKWQKFVSENILIPSGMKTSTITDGPHPNSGVAHGYIYSNGNWIEKDYGEEPTFAAAGNGGVWSSVEELALYEMALRKATFLKPETLKESFEAKEFSNWKSASKSARGWAWSIGKTREGYKTIWHDGFQGGFRANYVSVPEKRWLIVILSSAPRPLEEFTPRAFEFLNSGK